MRGGGKWFPTPPIEWSMAMLYDNIHSRVHGNINIPICVCLTNSPEHSSTGEVYLFFNNNMTAEEASIIVKHFLGITGEFVLEPALPIVPIGDDDALYDYLHPTFVKISKRTFSCEIKTGKVIDDKTDFDKVATVEHKIKKGNTNIKGIHANFMSLQHNENVKGTVLPDLYKEYIPKIEESKSFGLDKSEYKHYTQRRNLFIAQVTPRTWWTTFSTEKGDPITLTLMGDNFLNGYPYFSKKWWVEAEAKEQLLQKKKEEAWRSSTSEYDG
jgi:hypothetical protein